MSYEGFINKEDFVLIEVPADGTCFFHAIMGILHLDNKIIRHDDKNYTYILNDKNKLNKLSNSLRLKVVRWLTTHLKWKVPNTSIIEDEIKADNIPGIDSVNEYLEHMKDPKSWAGQIEMYAIHNLLKKNIKTYEASDDSTKYQVIHLGIGNTMDIMKDIYLFHSGGVDRGHFEILYPKKRAIIIDKEDYIKLIGEKEKEKEKEKGKGKKVKVSKVLKNNDELWEDNKKRLIRTIIKKKRRKKSKKQVTFSTKVKQI